MGKGSCGSGNRERICVMNRKSACGKILYGKNRSFALPLLLAVLCAAVLTGCALQKEEAAQKEAETARIGQLGLTVPEGYAASTTDGLYLNEEYPDDQSNIYLYATDKRADFAQVMENGQDRFIQYLADSYAQQYNERPEITLTRYEAGYVWSAPAYVIELSYDLQGTHYEQLEYIIDADRTYYVAFSQVGSYQWMEAFRVSAGTMTFFEAEE